MTRLGDALRRRLPLVHLAVDSSLWAIALAAGVWLRYDYSFHDFTAEILWAVALAVLLQALYGTADGLYMRRWRYGSFDELRMVAFTALAVGLTLTAAAWGPGWVPRSVPLLAMLIALFGQIAARSLWRVYNESRRRPEGDGYDRTIVIGAGSAGEQVVRTIRASGDSRLLPVAMLDDDPAKRRLRILGVRVDGTVDDLPAAAAKHRATTVLVAVPSAESSFFRRIADLAAGSGLKVLVLPAVDDLFDGVHIEDIRPISEVDLLGRHPTDIDTAAVAGYITGRRVLVTGAGGSIGSELCRQLAKFEPSELLMLDRDESGLHGTQLSIEGRAMLDSSNLILADIRDADRLDEVFAEHRPEVVFHAAALKHLPLLEMHPAEGWKTNVLGTRNLLASAQKFGVERFVNISTDKAANPTSVLGLTKRITERITSQASQDGPMVCVSVRFGNVLGSNGSVLRTFSVQAENGGPLTVTDPEVTRYFMLISEASLLTIYAGAIGDPGEVLILDMGEPVLIADVARRLASQHTPPLEIVYTGLRPNEKLHEDLISTDEQGECRIHPLITHVDVPPLQLHRDVEAFTVRDICQIVRDAGVQPTRSLPSPVNPDFRDLSGRNSSPPVAQAGI